MPRKPKSPCRYPGCPVLCEEPYCKKHKAMAASEYNRYRRDPLTKMRYGKQWRELRSIFVKYHPYCENCANHGKLVPVEVVHHKVPLADGGTNDFSNLMSLCNSCHNAIHNSMGRKRD